jgi:hypothetical protein
MEQRSFSDERHWRKRNGKPTQFLLIDADINSESSEKMSHPLSNAKDRQAKFVVLALGERMGGL